MSRRDTERDMDALAEMVSEGVAVTAAGRRIGLSAAAAHVLWVRICIRLGEEP